MTTRTVIRMGILVVCFAAGGAGEAATISGLHADCEVRKAKSDGTLSLGSATANDGLAGYTVNPDQSSRPVFVFQLPTVAAGWGFETADLRIRLTGKNGTPTFNGDLVGLGYRTDSAVLATDHDASSTMIQNDFVSPGSATGGKNTDATGDASPTAYLNAQLAASAKDRETGPAYVFFRVDQDSAQSGAVRYIFNFRESTTYNATPLITYTTAPIPEPATVALLGTFAGLGMLRRKRR